MKGNARIKRFKENMSGEHGMWWDILIGAGGALLAALVYVALYALSMRLFHINENSIPVTNEVAKVICMLLASLLAVWRRPSKGWLKGGIAGGLYVVLAFVLFSLAYGNWEIDWSFLSDLIMGMAVGAIGGILIVNFRKKR